MKDRTTGHDTSGYALEWVQSDLLLFHTGLALDEVAQVELPETSPAGIEGCFQTLASRVDQLRAEVLNVDPADDEPASGSRFATAIHAVDALERLASMAAALADAAMTFAYADSDTHLVDPEAAPGEQRPHLGSDGVRVDNGDNWLDRMSLTAAAVGPALRIGAQEAKNRVWDARQIARLAPHVHARRLAGDWSRWHAHVFLEALSHVDDDVLVDADTEIARNPGRIGIRTLRKRIERFLRSRRLPLTGADAQVEVEGHEARCVTLSPTDLFGMATLYAYLPALEARGIDRLLSDLAATAPHDDPRTQAQRRADVFLACFTGPAALNPAVASQLSYQPADVPDARFAATAVDPGQQRAAEEAWESLRLIGATLGITFAKPPPVEINVHVSATTMMDLAAARDGKHADGSGGTQSHARHLDATAWNHPPGWPATTQPPGREQPDRHTTGDPPSPPGTDVSCTRAYRDLHPRHFTPWIEGYGPITAGYLAVLLNDAVVRRVLTDPATGVPTDLGPPTWAHGSTAQPRRCAAESSFVTVTAGSRTATGPLDGPTSTTSSSIAPTARAVAPPTGT